MAAVRAQFDKQPWPAREPLPALQAEDQYGKTWAWAGLKGRPVLINFWATWCGPCKEELPSLQTLADLLGPEAVILTVNVKEPPDRALTYAQRSGLRLPVLMDPRGDLTRQFGVRIYPTTVLVGADGRPRYRVLGALDWSERGAQAWVGELARPGR